MKKDEMLNILEALADKVDIETGEVLDLNDRATTALDKALYELKKLDIGSTSTNKEPTKSTTESNKSDNLIIESISQLDEDSSELYERLRDYRFELSVELGLSPYTIGKNKTLLNMAYYKPTIDNFLSIWGVGTFINEKFGDGYISIIKEHLDKKKTQIIIEDDLPDSINNPCAGCGCEIPQARIDNVPGVVRCAPCQSEYEKDHPDSVVRKVKEEGILTREGAKRMRAKQYGTNIHNKI